MPLKHFEKKGKKLIYKLPPMERDSTYEQMGEMRDMFQYDFRMVFEKEINVIAEKPHPCEYELYYDL